jgi:hypothetical protein
MADDVMRAATDAQSSPSAPAAASPPAAVASRSERARRAAYRSRFTILYVLLAVLAGAAVGAFVVLVSRGSPAPAPPWSAWQPTGSSERREAQIAAQIGGRYHLPSGNQLVAVLAGSPTITIPDGTTFRVSAIAVRPNTSRGQAEATDIDAVNAADTVMYRLCGLGNACSIREGQPSLARAALLRREALELALYTFKYVEGPGSVLVLLPPRRDGKAAATAVFLERSDVKPELDHPFSQTLPARVAPGVGQMSPNELRVVERLTRPRFYEYSYVQGQDNSPIMVLTPIVGP